MDRDYAATLRDSGFKFLSKANMIVQLNCDGLREGFARGKSISYSKRISAILVYFPMLVSSMKSCVHVYVKKRNLRMGTFEWT
jgi:hypothetical protein